MMIMRFLLFLSCFLVRTGAEAPVPLTCSADQDDSPDPALKEMTYDVGDGPQKTKVYVQPDVTSFYKDGAPASTAVEPQHRGFAGKFINLSNQPVTLYWEEFIGGKKHKMRDHKPFSASGTATFPGHYFVFTPSDAPNTILKRFHVGVYPENLHFYDPYHVEGDDAATEKNLAALSEEERERYNAWMRTKRFHEQYFNFTGRSYLANYLRDPPIHYIWRADYFGQEHWVTTRETHFIKHPSEEEIEPILTRGVERKLEDDEPRLLQEYRVPDQQIMNMTLRVISCAPRAFEIPNFLSTVEVEHILKLAAGIELHLSATGETGDKVAEEESRRTRSSYNSWVSRESSPIIDSVYRRAADLMRIDEALLRHRSAEERPDVPDKNKLSEDLQLVHYAVGQEYTAHHDFGYSRIDNKLQGARFATLLLYLNDDMIGGETSFPRWVNAESFKELKVKPEVGKAMLFYSQLPDGNLDDFSQHAALPVRVGEKWLINLWVWSPNYT